MPGAAAAHVRRGGQVQIQVFRDSVSSKFQLPLSTYVLLSRSSTLPFRPPPPPSSRFENYVICIIGSALLRLPYADLFGGVSAMSREQFRLVNGFSNVFWGWGGEDDDMANRIKAHGLHISRYPANVARYKMLTHKKEKANPKR